MINTISKNSLTAHNTGKEFPTGNGNYNIAHKLGEPEERLHLEGIAMDEYDFKHEKLSKDFLRLNYGIRVT